MKPSSESLKYEVALIAGSGEDHPVGIEVGEVATHEAVLPRGLVVGIEQRTQRPPIQGK